MEDYDPTQAAFRIALAMMCADVTSHYSRWERDYWVTRLQVVDATGQHLRFTHEERRCAMDSLLHWADMRSADFGKLLRRLFEGGAPEQYIRHGTQLELISSPTTDELTTSRRQNVTPVAQESHDVSTERKG